MNTVESLGIEAQTHPEIDRLAREYPISKAQIAGAYVTCRGDIEAVELIVRLSVRPIASDLIEAIIDVMREGVV